MDEVRFDEQPAVVKAPPSVRSGGLIGFLVRQGYARDEKAAQKVLMVVLGLLVIVMVATLLLGNGTAPTGEPQPLPEDLIR